MSIQNVFDYSGQVVRTVMDGEVVWFVAKDVCAVLEIKNHSDALSRLSNKQKSVLGVSDPHGRVQNTSVINESGVYKLIFRSNKPEAETFSDWVAEQVLPSIRKTGGYVNNDDLFVDTYLKHADEKTKLIFRSTLETVRKQNERISEMSPKAEYFDALVDRNLLTNFRDTAKELKVKERKFTKWLEEKKFVYRDSKSKLKPYAQFVDNLFELKEWERYGKSGNQTLITPKGRETFRLLLQKEA
jgi:prophage antirepressor-like protein